MHIRDRLRAAFLQKRASLVCWRCAFVSGKQLRSVQTVHGARLDDDAAPKEDGPLLGNIQRKTSNNPRISTLSTQKQSDNASYTSLDKFSLNAKYKALRPISDDALPWVPIRRTYIDRSTVHVRRKDIELQKSEAHEPPMKRFATSDAKWIRFEPWKEAHISQPQDMEVRVLAAAKNASAESRHLVRRTVPTAVVRKVIADGFCAYDSSFLECQAKGEARGRVLSTTKSNGRRIVGEIDEMFQSWLGAAERPSETALFRSPSAEKDHESASSTDKGSSSSAPSMNDLIGRFPSSENDDPQARNPLAPPDPPFQSSFSGRDATWLSSGNHQSTTVNGRCWRPTSATRIFPSGEPSHPSRSHVARLHTCIAFMSRLEGQRSLSPDLSIVESVPDVNKVGIREHLRSWQEFHDQEVAATSPPDRGVFQEPRPTENAVTQSLEDEASIVADPSDLAPSREWGLVSVPGQDPGGEGDVGHYLRPGDVIGFGTKFGAMLGVFIRNFDTQSQFYTMQGKWMQMGDRYVSFVIPGVFSQQDIDPIVRHLPDVEVKGDDLGKFLDAASQVPREVGAPLLEKLQAMERASAEIYREHAERFDRVHILVASETSAKELTLHEIAMIVLQKQSVNELTDIMLWAVDKVLVRNPYFVAEHGARHRVHPMWTINPPAMIQSIEQVRGWIRDYVEGEIAKATSPEGASSVALHQLNPHSSNPLPAFLCKAKGLVESSRALRKVTAYSGLGPISEAASTGDSGAFPPAASLAAKTLTSFDEREQEIIHYLKTWSFAWEVSSAGSTFALSPLLLRATGLYQGHALDQSTVALFLREIGVIAPWENRFLYKRNVHLPHSDELDDINKAKPAGVPSTHTDARLNDSLGDLRKDWGNLPVYCIDDASAQEIDDGVSVEKVEGEDSIFWVHIHVANPSAFLAPSSTIGRHAAKLMGTTYLPEKTSPLLSPKLTQSYFSLAKDRPVLTMSAKVTMDGRILATDITAGWIRNTRSITPERVSEVSGLDQNSPPKDTRVLHVGRRPTASKHRVASQDTLSPSEVAELRILQKLGTARRLYRTYGSSDKLGYQGAMLQTPEVYLGEGNAFRTFKPSDGRQFLSDPSITWEVSDVDMTGELAVSGGALFVADIMVIAGEIASKWCGERNIPIIYRGTVRDPAPPISPEVYKFHVTDRCRRELGYVPIMIHRTYNRYLGSSTARSFPFPHLTLGMESYTKATSPLRRYPDLLAHWQMQAALIHEARHGKGSLIGSTDNTYLPFSRSDIDAFIPTVRTRERSISEVSKHSTVYWIMQLLHRAFYFKEAELPRFFDVLVHQEPGALMQDGNALGFTKQLSGIDADVLDNELTKREGGIKVGDWWRCRIEGVNLHLARVRMMPVRLTARGAIGVPSALAFAGRAS